MTKKEQKEIKKQIDLLQKQLLEVEKPIKYKPKSQAFKEGHFTTSKINLYLTHCIFIGIIIFAMIVSVKYLKDTPEWLAGVIISLSGGGLTAILTTTKYYSSKATVEQRLKSAMQLAQYLNANKITLQSVYLAKLLSEDESTSISSINPFGGVTQIDTNKYMASNPMADNQPQYNAGNVSNSEDVINTPATDNMAQG